MLSAVEFLTDKFLAEFQSAQKPFSGVTAQTVMHYANISVSDVYNCLVWLAREGLVERRKTHELPEWVAFSGKMQKDGSSAVSLAALEAKEKQEIARLKKISKQELEKLKRTASSALTAMREVDEASNTIFGRGALLAQYDTSVIESHLANLEATLIEKQTEQAGQLSRDFAEKRSALKVEVTPEERELWDFRKSLPQYAYLVSDSGRQLLQNARTKYSAGSQGFVNILKEVDRRISALNLMHKPTAHLGLAHVLEDKLEDISFGVHREMLNEWGQLPQDRILLFYLHSGPFVFDFGDGRTETRNLSYIGPKTENSKLLAKIYADGEDRILARNGVVSILGLLSMDETEAERFKGLAKSASAELESAAGLPQKYGQELRDHMRYGRLMLAPTETERANCNVFGITYSDARITVFDVQGVESVKLIGENTRVMVPEQLAKSYTILFLPKFFDRKGLRFRPRQ